MTALAWLLIEALILVPAGALLWTRPKPTRCACGGFKLPRAAQCFTCTTR